MYTIWYTIIGGEIMSSNIRISEGTKNILKMLAIQKASNMQAVLDEAVELYRRKVFFEKLDSAYLNNNQDEDFLQEISSLEATLSDGLNEEYFVKAEKNERI